jgi:hypothetical protein
MRPDKQDALVKSIAQTIRDYKQEQNAKQEPTKTVDLRSIDKNGN